MTTNVILQPPSDREYGAFYASYVAAVTDGDILETLRSQGRSTCALLESLGDEQARWRYAPGKWSIKEIAGHLADGERVFSYRALRIGRGDATPLPGFEQDDYVANARFDDLSMQQLVKEVATVRAGTISLFEQFTYDESLRMGSASGTPVSVRALAYMIAGHEKHHVSVIREKYLRSN